MFMCTQCSHCGWGAAVAGQRAARRTEARAARAPLSRCQLPGPLRKVCRGPSRRVVHWCSWLAGPCCLLPSPSRTLHSFQIPLVPQAWHCAGTSLALGLGLYWAAKSSATRLNCPSSNHALFSRSPRNGRSGQRTPPSPLSHVPALPCLPLPPCSALCGHAGERREVRLLPRPWRPFHLHPGPRYCPTERLLVGLACSSSSLSSLSCYHIGV